MTYLATQAVSSAYYLSGLVGREIETVQGFQLTDGLRFLNQILSEFALDIRKIPFYGYNSIDLVAGQEIYFVQGLAEVTSDTFLLNDVRIPMQRMTREEYFATARVEGLQSLPFTYFADRILNGTNIYLYPLPNDTYSLQILGKYFLSSVMAGTDLSEVLELNFIEFLEFALAKKIAMQNGITLPPDVAQEFNRLSLLISDIAPLDLSCRKSSTFNANNASITWPFVNLSNGWTPS